MAKWNLNASSFDLYTPTVPAASPVNAEDIARIDDDVDLNEFSLGNLSLVEEDEGDEYEDQTLDTLAPAELLQMIFNLPIDEIGKILESTNFDFDMSIEKINTINSGKSQVPANQVGETHQPRQVCRHFLAGTCYRKDCWFSHDFDKVVCKYWLQGRCINGNNCNFAHGDSIVEKFASVPARTITKPPQKEASKLQSEHFPVLSNYNQPKPKFDFFAPTSQFSEALKKTNSKLSQQPTPTSFRGVSTSTSLNSGVRKISNQAPARWVTTGDTLASQYHKFREEAIDVALARNKFFQKATEAYLQGNKAAAKAFSLQAHALNQNLSELHEQASEKIFASRNGTESLGTVDLHGLHAEEATRLLNKHLKSMAQQTPEGVVTIITGSGHHSRNKKAKVLPAVREFLQRKGWRYRETGMKDGYGGLILVDLISILN
ncbi:hypothetical protein HK096_003379 [Nowakowskiella sp. JEL0078]|nr:hypothetical protein HK096_003379 [Nowakowskiella sp. JEL0078]